MIFIFSVVVSVEARAIALPAAFILVLAQRRRLSRNGKPARWEAECVLAGLHGAARRRGVRGNRSRRPSTGAKGYRKWFRRQDDHAEG